MNLRSVIPWRERSSVPATRDDFFDPMLSFRREVQRMFDDFFNGFGGRGLLPQTGAWQVDAPAVDVDETDKEIVVTAEMPGLDPKDFDVSVAGDVLTIKGEKKFENERNNGDGYYRERRYGAFSRSIRLPYEVNDEKLDASYDKGVLTIRMPKPAEAQKPVRRIEVKSKAA